MSNKNKNKNIDGNNVLAIDPASECGWAISSIIYGIWNLKTLPDESMGMKLIRFQAKIQEICESNDIKIIVYESAFGTHARSLKHHNKLVGVIEKYCESNNIDYKGYPPTKIKLHAGKGNASKSYMIKKAKEMYGYTGDNDNEADALHLLHLYKEEYG